MIARFKLVDKVAKTFVEEHRHLYKPALDIDRLLPKLEKERIFVKEKALGDVSGAAMVDGKKRVIVINEKHHDNRKRFTFAHELAHLYLHGDQALNVDSEESPIFLRDERSSTGEYWREVEANRLAAAILMPADLLREELDSVAEDEEDNDEITRKLAQIFKVSDAAMANRRSSLGF